MMAVRADMTTQVARIATTRLGHLERPLRLYYAGQVLRVRGSQLRPERQYAQAGVELIGSSSVEADVEIITLAAAALGAIGIENVTVDLALPAVPGLICTALQLDDDDAARLRKCLDQKDDALAATLPEAARVMVRKLLRAPGPVDDALAVLAEIDLPDSVAPQIESLRAVAARLREVGADLTLTADPGESRGFAYQTGIACSFFARGVRGELGRGGRYALANGEPATGFTLYLDTVVRAAPGPAPEKLIYLPHDAADQIASDLRADGHAVLGGFAKVTEPRAEARRLRCSHVWLKGRIEPVGAEVSAGKE